MYCTNIYESIIPISIDKENNCHKRKLIYLCNKYVSHDETEKNFPSVILMSAILNF